MKKLYTIGRDSQNDIVIEDNTDIISRLHATIRFDGIKMYLIDQSQNGTYVNGMRMSSNEEVPVTRKDTVSLANIYDLDWNRLPDPKKDLMRKIWIAVLSILAILIIAGAIYYFMRPTNPEDVSIEESTEKPAETPNDENEVDVEKDQPLNPVDKDTVGKTTDVPTPTDGSNSNKPKKQNPTTPVEKSEESETGGDIPLY